MTAFVFPGQGSQARGMGGELFDLKEYCAVERDVDALLGYSLRRLCLDDPENRLKETQYTQPSLYVVNSLHVFKAVVDGARPTHVAGHSLGEYNALCAAGVFDFMTGLRLVKMRGELMAQAKDGGMGAVIGLDRDTIAAVVRDSGLAGVDVANFNSPVQTVISGPVAEIARAGQLLEQAGARMYMPLPVSAAFHSRYMREFADQFEEFLRPFSFAPPRIPVISNVTAEPYPADSESIKSLLVRQITQSVEWTRSIRWLLAQGVTDIREVGPGKVLTRLVQQIQQDPAR
ncbi:ACP S-malonyltransferase [Tahibacter amnicola]|uniref:Malonyl CoA-acyl carrier protein transacylase n=1 Tax=Tahibacter amnicola TaxID=2976241 RepID=A0ABY6B7Q7_9GAMM|nr:ACP S-malonyltransferase [Tahibacter amnicola]UXI65924.1 ACP S-malonyltransferase [Tahibacter amnicola]